MRCHPPHLLAVLAFALSAAPAMPDEARPARPDYWSTREEPFAVRSGEAEVCGHVHAPNAKGRFPVVVLVPGGIGSGGSFDIRNRPGNVYALVRRGYIAIHFDPPGRGRSRGEEDHNGFRGQNALAEVIRFASRLAAFDRKSLGVMTHSYGITLGAGCLARHPELPVRYLFDNEGPSSAGNICYRMPTGQPLASIWGPFLPPEEHADFWRERQAALFIGRARARYFRFQKARDHVHGERYDHAMEMLNAATEAGVRNRCNDNPPNTRYDPAHPERYRWEPDDSRMLDYLDELAGDNAR